MSKRSVCFVLPSAYGYFNPDVEAVGGGARQLSFVSRAITDRYDVHFVVGDYGQPRREVRDGITLHRAYRPARESAGWRKPLQLLRLFDAMRRAGADVYVYRGRPYLAAITNVLARSLRAGWVYNLANDPNVTEQPAALPDPLRVAFDRAVRRADAIIAQTDAQARLLEDSFGVTSTVVPSGYPPAGDVRAHDERSSFLWVGRLDRDQKRPHLFLDIAERVPGQSFEMIGPGGADEAYTERIVDRARDVENVTYHGRVRPDEVHRFFKTAMALVNTSKYEGFPSTFLEAWRYDTPVLSLDIRLSRYTTEAADEGFADGDLDRLASMVRELGSNPEHRVAVSGPAYEYFLENLTIDAVARRYGDVLEAAME